MITANFSAYASYTVDSVYQWDLNRTLDIIGLSLPSTPEAHFANSILHKAIARTVTASGSHYTVGIPNSLLQYDSDITVYIGIYSGTEFKVIESIRIPVIARKRPDDYQIQDSDEEIYSFNSLKSYVDIAVNEMRSLGDRVTEGTNADMEELTANLTARLASLIVNNTDTEGNSELIDMRVDAEGTTHELAGDALRYVHNLYNTVALPASTLVNSLNQKAVQMEDGFISNCNTFLKTAYGKTKKGTTLNLPTEVNGTDGEWGVVLCIMEDEEYGAGTQIYYPIDGTYKGRIFVRNLLHMKTDYSAPGSWQLLATKSDIDKDYRLNYVNNKLQLKDGVTVLSEVEMDLGDTYTAGNGIKIENNQISLNVDVADDLSF